MTGQTQKGARTASNSESGGRFHTNWLSMMYPRLKLARNLLQEDGLIAISADDNEIDHLRNICAEVFGEENFAAQISVASNPRGRQSDTFFATVHEYLLLYAKSAESCAIDGAPLSDEQRAEFDLKDPQGRPYRLLGLRQRGAASLRKDRPDMYFPIYVDPKRQKVALEPAPGFTEKVLPRKSTGEDGRWMWGAEKCKKDLHLLVPRLIERRGEYDIFVIDHLDKNGQERTRKYKTIWDDKKLNTQNGTQEVKELLGADVLSFPKPVALLQDIVQLGSSQEDIVLDFFAGSGTTGHAVMKQNALDGGRRRYILVQLPEPLNPEDKNQKAASDYCDKLKKPRNLAELTKERLRRSAKKTKGELRGQKLDLGFRVFKLDSSNIREWIPENFEDALQKSIEHLETGRAERDILYELILKLGLDLCIPFERKQVRSKEVYAIGGGVLMVCMAEKINKSEVDGLALGIADWHKALRPAGEVTCIFRDSAFEDDVAKTNAVAILEQNGLKNVRSL